MPLQRPALVWFSFHWHGSPPTMTRYIHNDSRPAELMINRSFIEDFIAADMPCFELGLKQTFVSPTATMMTHSELSVVFIRKTSIPIACAREP